MRSLARKSGVAALLGALLMTGVAADARPRQTGEQRLAKALEGREAGTPVDCIYMPTVRNSQIFDKTAIVYDAGNVLYVQRPRVGVESLDDDDVLVTRLTSSELCSIDTIQLIDRTSRFYHGFVGLDKFVPYRKPAKVAAGN
jgi:hypothetical protein